MPLELWFVTRMVTRNLNLYLDTLYSAFEMIASGITTVQHLHGWMPGKLAEVEARCRRGDPRLRGCRHAGVLLVRGARPEPAGVSGRRGLRRQPAGGAARADAALVRPVPAFARRLLRAVREPARPPPEQEPREDPVGAGQPALVLRRGADAARRDLAQIQRAAAHASAGDGVSEGICAPPRRRHRGGVHRPLRPARTADDAGPWRLAERGRTSTGWPRPAPASATTARPISACAPASRR